MKLFEKPAWNAALLVLSAVGLAAVSLLLAFGDYSLGIFVGYFAHPLIALLNILPVLALEGLLFCLTNRVWAAFLITSVPVLAFSLGNYFKLLFRDDPFLAADFSSIGIALKISSNYNVSIDLRIAFCLLCVAGGAVILFFIAKGRAPGKARIITAALLAALCVPLSLLYVSDDIYENKTQNYEHANQWSSTEHYICRGFIYPFLHSIPDAFPEKPEGYSDSAAEAILAQYPQDDIEADKRVNLIFIQLEAFNDLERLGINDISPEVYAAFHSLEAESYAGTLVTNVFAGGTVDTERCIMTGEITPENYRGVTDSYIRYFKSQGYFTEGSHSSYAWFYNRQNINSYLGFDSYWFFENRYSELAGGNIAMDNIMLPDILKLYGERDKSVPYLSYSVTYQGHGPYNTDGIDAGDGGALWTGEYADIQTYNILNNYLNSVKETGEELAAFADALRDDEAPVVLVIYGDHNPWLGYGNSVYNELGVELDASTEQGFYNYYGTRYLIWANDAAKAALGSDVTGEGPAIGPSFLMNVVFDVCGLGGGDSYMQLASQVMANATAITENGWYIENGSLTTELTDGTAELLAQLRIAEYYRKFRFSLT